MQISVAWPHSNGFLDGCSARVLYLTVGVKAELIPPRHPRSITEPARMHNDVIGERVLLIEAGMVEKGL
jgi:hypothetical protein